MIEDMISDLNFTYFIRELVIFEYLYIVTCSASCNR